MAPQVTVVGSINRDLVASVPHVPVPGETVMATGHATHAGGKGANQATAAARMGAAAAMVGRVGEDAAGRELVAGLEADGVDTTWISRDDSVPTGLAMITVADSAENAITVSPGANATLTAAHVTAAGAVIETADVLLVQLEVPLDAVAAAVRLARGQVILNPAPAAALPRELIDGAHVVIPNETELEALTGVNGLQGLEEIEAAARSLASNVIVTLGSRGALVVTRSSAHLIGAPQVEAVDTTGAGDAFCGAIAAELARGAHLEAAARLAVRAAAIAVTRRGAQASMAHRHEIALET